MIFSDKEKVKTYLHQILLENEEDEDDYYGFEFRIYRVIENEEIRIKHIEDNCSFEDGGGFVLIKQFSSKYGYKETMDF